ncbi:hypothetical protein C8J56DRAFT_897752 [Mycena floridula]|nr:hypothetical protein C8J56DRAFT_897752 [Mycena floridula]
MASFGVHWLELVTMDTTATSVMRREQYNFGTRMTGWSAEKTWIPNNVVRYHRIERRLMDIWDQKCREICENEEKGLIVGAGIPPHAILSNLSWSPCLAVALSVELLRGIPGLAEKMTRWDQELVPFHSLYQQDDSEVCAPSNARAWSSKQAAVMVFEEAATISEIRVILSGAYGLLVTWNFLASSSDDSDRLSLVTSLAVHRFQTNPFCFESLDAASSLRHWFTFHHRHCSQLLSAGQRSTFNLQGLVSLQELEFHRRTLGPVVPLTITAGLEEGFQQTMLETRRTLQIPTDFVQSAASSGPVGPQDIGCRFAYEFAVPKPLLFR